MFVFCLKRWHCPLAKILTNGIIAPSVATGVVFWQRNCDVFCFVLLTKPSMKKGKISGKRVALEVSKFWKITQRWFCMPIRY